MRYDPNCQVHTILPVNVINTKYKGEEHTTQPRHPAGRHVYSKINDKFDEITIMPQKINEHY